MVGERDHESNEREPPLVSRTLARLDSIAEVKLPPSCPSAWDAPSRVSDWAPVPNRQSDENYEASFCLLEEASFCSLEDESRLGGCWLRRS